MKNLFLILAWIAVNSSILNSQKISNEDLVNRFFAGMNQQNFEIIKSSTAEKFTITEGDQVLCNSREEFYSLFRWDSVFIPEFEIIEFMKHESYLRATISKSCKRIRFLHDSPLIYNVDIFIEGERIREMRTRDYLNADFRKWTLRRDMLKVWSEEKHSEIPEFINDMSVDGARNYVRAIELWEKEKLK